MTECVGACTEHTGEVYEIEIRGVGFTNKHFYCQAAREADTANGFSIKPCDPTNVLRARIVELEKAIGIMAPTVCRAFLLSPTIGDIDRDVTYSVLKRLNNAMGQVTEPLEELLYRKE